MADLFGKLVVRAAPRRRRALLIASAIGILLAAYAIFELGRYEAGYRVIDSVRGALAASSRIRALEAENSRMRAELAASDVARRVDREGYKQVEQSLGDMQNQIARLKQDLSFYRGLVQPDSLVHVKVQQMQIVPEASGQYRLKFILMQAGKPDSAVSGTVALTVDGLLGGKPLSLAFAQVSPNRRVSLAYSFRYFEGFDEIVRLPAGFEPTRIDVELHSGKDQNHGFRQAFVWKAQGMSVETEANGANGPKDAADVQAETD